MDYPQSLSKYTGNILLVGINYDKKTKGYSCVIETCKRDKITQHNTGYPAKDGHLSDWILYVGFGIITLYYVTWGAYMVYRY